MLLHGSLLLVEDGEPLCLTCADLDHLVYVPRGDPALSRRARKHSTLFAVVVQFSRTRRRYERQGILVEEAALEKAQEECLSDAQLRAYRRERDALRRSGEDEAHASLATHDLVHTGERDVNPLRQLLLGHAKRLEELLCQHFSRGSGRPPTRSSDHRAHLHPDTALRLARLFKTSPEFWLHGQLAWDLYHTTHSRTSKEIEKIRPVA